MTNGQAGKGDRYRAVNMKSYAKNYEEIFGKQKLIKTWNPNEDSTDVVDTEKENDNGKDDVTKID